MNTCKSYEKELNTQTDKKKTKPIIKCTRGRGAMHVRRKKAKPH